MTKRTSNKWWKAKRKAKSKITWRRTSLGPLSQGQRLDTFETKPCLRKEHKPQIQSSNNTKSSPCTYASSLEPKHTPPEPMQRCNMAMQQKAKTCSLCTGWLDRMPLVVRLPLLDLTTWGRLDRPKKPVLHQTFQKLPEPLWTPSKCSHVPKTCTNFSPLLTMHESRQNVKSFIIDLLKYKMLHMSKWEVRYSIAS
jgi:hypothetical protein